LKAEIYEIGAWLFQSKTGNVSMDRDFEIIGAIRNIESIAIGSRIRGIDYLQKIHGRGRWRKLKGIADVRLANGGIRRVELHWYEAHGIGQKDMKIKRYLD
jgi:hypothetical protein